MISSLKPFFTVVLHLLLVQPNSGIYRKSVNKMKRHSVEMMEHVTTLMYGNVAVGFIRYSRE